MMKIILSVFYCLPSKMQSVIRRYVLLVIYSSHSGTLAKHCPRCHAFFNHMRIKTRNKIEHAIHGGDPQSKLPDVSVLNTLSQLVSLQLYRDILTDVRYTDPRRLERFGCKFYSQNDEDGIIAEIFRRIGTTNRMFLEFGVSNGLENNTLLLTYHGWQGVWLDGGEENIAFINDKFQPLLANNTLRVRQQWITAETINTIIQSLDLPKDLDLLSIDIDGNDYYVFKNIECIRPRVVVIEFNSKLPPPVLAVMRYKPDFQWEQDKTDYFGCSLESLTQMADKKGYQLVGSNITGCNAFFVRKDLCGEHFFLPATATALYNPPRYEIFTGGAFRIGHPASYGPWEQL
ncbi:MAG: FkbM family methyltransferase [Magnetococcales bacterium]|nr:FkbM family methyltransferase [Magnetococcales bacterium]